MLAIIWPSYIRFWVRFGLALRLRSGTRHWTKKKSVGGPWLESGLWFARNDGLGFIIIVPMEPIIEVSIFFSMASFPSNQRPGIASEQRPTYCLPPIN